MTQQKIYKVLFTDTYIHELGAIKKHGRNVALAIQEAAEGLYMFPDKKGYPLTRELSGLWSKRVYRQRYRLIYQIKDEPAQPTVEVLFTGIRKAGNVVDVYDRAKKVLGKSLKKR